MSAENDQSDTQGNPDADDILSEDTDPAPGENDTVTRLESELSDSRDRLLRALAETENVRRRGEREREQERRFAATNFGKDMLNVADNLRRALDSAPEAQAQDDFTRTLLSGVAATERELLSAFERHGIRRIAPEPGEKFDHNIHQAMFEVEHTGKPAGSIVQVLQNGYLMHDRLLRPALVGVAKADAKPPETPRVDTMA